MKILKIIALFIVLACIVSLTIEADLLLRETRLKVDALSGGYAKLVEPGMKAEAAVASAGIALAQVAANERNAFDSQQKYFARITTRTDTLFDSLNEGVRQINENILPVTAIVLNNADNTSSRLADNFDIIGSTIASIGSDVDRDIQKTTPILDNLSATSVNVKNATADAAATMVDVHKSADYLYAQLTKPVKKVGVAVKFAASLLGDFFHL